MIHPYDAPASEDGVLILEDYPRPRLLSIAHALQPQIEELPGMDELIHGQTGTDNALDSFGYLVHD
jgi:hypothetical protein